DPETSTVSLRVGRQDLSFGHPRLIGTSYWRNASSGYDAAMVAINSPRLKVNAWAASPVVVYDNGLSHHVQGNNFHGIYTTVNNPVPQSTIEPYVLWRLSPGFKTQAGQPAKLDEKTVGVRWAGQAARFDYDAEISAQTGSVGSDRIRAWAWSTIAGYTMESAPLKPRVFVKYDFASGDRNPGDGVRGTFDQLYPNIHDHHGLADIVAWQNLAAARAGIRASLKSNWIVALTYNDWWLANPRDAFYSASGAPVARDRTGRSGRHIGREYDAQTSFRLNRNLELGSGIAYIRSGEFLLRANRARSFMYRYVMVYYNVL
ncbi:MAG: alginate export family protein, partial [Acidobacteria bacterium]|nr:alginate export family protein [Acidobacteriota bacterium]